MKKIFFVANIQYTLTHFRSELIDQLRSMGHEVYLICPNTEGNLHVEQSDPYMLDIKLSRGGLNPLKEFVTFMTLARLYRKEKPDIVLNFTIKPIIYSSLAAGFFSSKTRIFSNITGLGYVFTDKSLKAKIVRVIVTLLYKLSFKFNQRVFFQNPDDEQLFQKMGLIDPKKSKRLNGSGINLERIQLSHLPKEPQSFIFVGRLLRDKGLLELVDAVKLLSKDFPLMKCYIVGGVDDNPNSFTPEAIKEFSKCPSLIFLGHRKDVIEIMSKCEVNVLPAYREGTPRTNLEAMASGLPIITTDAPGCRETVIDGHNGYLIPIKDSNKLMEKMRSFLENPDQISWMGQNSRKFVEQKFDVKNVNREILNTIGVL